MYERDQMQQLANDHTDARPSLAYRKIIDAAIYGSKTVSFTYLSKHDINQLRGLDYDVGKYQGRFVVSWY